MKGIIMAGGSGTRLHPITKAVNKHLLPIYNKPLIYYPLSTLMLAGIREILIVTTPRDIVAFRELLGSGNQFGVQIKYEIQDAPNGIAEGIKIGKDFLDGNPCGFILGDNVFHGVGLGRQLQRFLKPKGAYIFAYPVTDPQRYGVIEIGQKGEILSLEEKPESPKSNLAVTGLYFYDENVTELVNDLRPSSRGELEITELNSAYLQRSQLNVEVLSSGTAWLDTGTFHSLHDASTYIQIIEERQGIRISDPARVAVNHGWLTD
jgi:glucose-1-phosphate thymidylyltransferase